MTSIVLLDLLFTAILLLLIASLVWFRLSTQRTLKAQGIEIGAVITHVRRNDIAQQSCVITAAWTDPRTGRRWTYRGFRLDLGYQPGQLISIRLDPQHPSHFLMQP